MIVHVLYILLHSFVVPNLSVTVFPTSYQTIDIVPFNDFTLKCMAIAYVQGQIVPLAISVVWTRQQDGISEKNVSSSYFETSGTPEVGYQSILSTTESMITSVTYRCKASLNVGRKIQGSSQSVVTVVSKYNYMDCVLVCLFVCLLLKIHLHSQ